VSGAQRDSSLGRAVERDGDHPEPARLARSVAAGRDYDCARRAAEQSFADGAQQHAPKRSVVRGADHDQIGLLGHRGVVEPASR
jgi:hypothetical protein